MKYAIIVISSATMLILLFLCTSRNSTTHTTTPNTLPPDTLKTDSSPKLTIQSNSFKDGDSIPSIYTCDDKNISPQLSWTYLDTQNTQKINSYVLIVDDPDAQKVVGKTFVHWLALLPSHITQLPEGISGNKQSSLSTLDKQAQEIANDYAHPWYDGPCPPPNNGTHTYRFTLFATATSIDHMKTDFFKSPFTAQQFKQTMKESIIAEALLTGTYTRENKK